MVGQKDKAVVIGAGMGGLASAIRLAAAGLDVTVIEAMNAPGGKMRTVESAAGPVDAGPTVMTMRHVFDDLFDLASKRLDDHLTLHRETILARHWWPDGSALDLYADPEASIDAVGKFAGKRAASDFAAFSRRAAQLFTTFEGPMMQASEPTLPDLTRHVMRRPGIIPAMAPTATLARQLAKQFSDPRLRQLFGRYATYVGGSPYQSPAILGLIWHAEASGVWGVDGGMHRLAVALESLAKDLGATFQFGTRVAEIETIGDHVGAVRTEAGDRIETDRVVFNGDPRALELGLVGSAATMAVEPKGTSPRSLSACVWSFASAVSGPDLTHHNVFFGSDPRDEFDPIAAGRLPEDATLYVCAQDRRSGSDPAQNERFEIIMNAPPTTDGTVKDIDLCRTRTFPPLARHGLIFAPEPPDEALTTPAMFDQMFPGSAGSLYGLSPHGLMAAFQRPTARSKVPGLYLAGGGAHPGAGVPMAALSGKHAAEAILTDLASTSTSRQTATRGGTSTASATVAPELSRSSPS